MKTAGRGEVLTACPVCHKDKLAVNVFKRVGHCWSCGHRVGGRDLKDVYNPIIDGRVNALTRVPVLTDPWYHDDARAYVRLRGIGYNHPQRDLCTYDTEMRRIYFRISSPVAEYAPSYHTRGIDRGTGWIAFPGTKKEHYVFGAPQKDRVILVEGIFDAMAIGYGAVAILGSELYPSIEAWLVREGKKVWTWFDPDDAGEKATNKIGARLRSRGIDVTSIRDQYEPSDAWQQKDNACKSRVQMWLQAHPVFEGVDVEMRR